MSVLSLRPAIRSHQFARFQRECHDVNTHAVDAAYSWTRGEQRVGKWLGKAICRCQRCGLVGLNMLHENTVNFNCQCQDKHESTPAIDDYPRELRNLSVAATLALRIIEVHHGRPQQHRHGYARKDPLTHLSWSSKQVAQKIAELPIADRRKAHAAYAWLLQHNCAYRSWDDALQNHLHRNGKLSMEPSAILLPRIEIALWPHRYVKKVFCESNIYTAWQRAGGACNSNKRPLPSPDAGPVDTSPEKRARGSSHPAVSAFVVSDELQGGTPALVGLEPLLGRWVDSGVRFDCQPVYKKDDGSKGPVLYYYGE